MSSSDSLAETLSRLRGELKPARANARTIAGLTGNPGCSRRRIIDAARVRPFELADRLGFASDRGQSPFAITAGNQFERRLKKGSDYTLLVEALQPFVTLPTPLRHVDVGEVGRAGLTWDAWLRKRAKKTDEVLSAIAAGAPGAPHIVDHPVLTFDVGGVSVFLEPDALAFRVGSHLELVEIKSYAIIDGQADPDKLASTGGQAAVYLLALEAALRRLGFDPAILHPSVILVAPKNFGRTPTAHRVPLKKKMMAIQRVLRALPKTESVVEHVGLPANATFDVDVKKTGGKAKLEAAVRSLPMLYTPECLAACDMARFCRNQAIVEDDPSRLGRTARDQLAGVHTLADALRLATEGPRPSEAHLRDVGDALRAAKEALDRARKSARAGGGRS